jgi:uncharacterized integral membrane protein
MIYTLRLFNIDGLPSYKMVDLFMVMLNNQMVYIYIIIAIIIMIIIIIYLINVQNIHMGYHVG